MSTQHLILGELTDFITGRTLVDTHDERARQKIARFLVEQKGYSKEDIETRRVLPLTLDGDEGAVTVDFILKLDDKAFAVIMFAPGSVVTRERSTVAVARLVEQYAVPFAVVTNGVEAEVLETKSGAVVARGLDGIPSKLEATNIIGTVAFESMPKESLEKEKRILFAFEVLAERECDEFTCSLY
jgi:hypothetical protein